HWLHRSSDDAAVGGYREELVFRANNNGSDQATPAFRDLRRQDALAAAPLHRVLVDGGSFCITAASRYQDVHAVAYDLHGQELVPLGEPHADHTSRCATHRAQSVVGCVEADCLSVL